jgi:hypothetical protein
MALSQVGGISWAPASSAQPKSNYSVWDWVDKLILKQIIKLQE